MSSREMMELAARAVKKGNFDVSEQAKTLMLVLSHDWQGIKELKVEKVPHLSVCFSEYAEVLEFEEKAKLIDIMGESGDESSWSQLLDFATQKGEFQEASIRALGKIRKEKVTNTLSDYLISGKSDDENILIALISTLGNLKKASLVPLLDKYIDHDFEEVRKETAIALEKLGVDTYKSIVSGSENDLYFLALEGRSNKAIQELFSDLKSYSYDTRKDAALKLIELAKVQPDMIKGNLAEIRKLITSSRVNNHSDNTIFRSNDCDHHTDHHEDSGIGMRVPF
jgi:hypothetical protein